MEVDMIISAAIEEISSPSTLAAAIGIAPNSKLRLYRGDDHEEGNAQQQSSVCTKMVLRCDKSQASHLRRRFGNARPYTHGGLLTSLKFTAMRPVTVVADIRDTQQHTNLPGSAANARLRGCSRMAQLTACHHSSSSLRCPSTPRRWTSSSAQSGSGVQDALDLVEQQEDAGLSVPGVAELWEAFLHCATTPIVRVGRHTAARRRRGEGKDDDDEEEKLGERGTRRGGGESELSYDESAEERKRAASSSEEEKKGYSPSCPRDECGVGHRNMPRQIRLGRPGQSQSRTHRKQTTRRWSRDIVREHRLRWYCRRAVACVADVAAALIRICRVYSDAPRPTNRSAVVSLLAELYADGAVFAGNRQRDMETLDQLGVVRWYSLGRQAQPSSLNLEAFREPKSKKAIQSWGRLLGRVMGLVRNIVDFGIFLQLYVAAAATATAERDRASASSAAAVAMTPDNRRCSSTNSSRNRVDALPPAEENNGRSFNSKWCCNGRGGNAAVDSRSPPPFFDDSRSATGDHHKLTTCDHYQPDSDQDRDPESSQNDDRNHNTRPHALKWLFPACEDGGRRAFHRHVVCGGAVHGMIPVEAVAAIIEDAGKILPADRVWRWCCARWERENGRNHLLLGFEEFVELCEGLKEHMVDAGILSPEDHV